MRLFGLIGFPLTHSFSKKYFDQKFEREKLADCRFENFPIKTISELDQLLRDHPELAGLAVTIPYKQSVFRYLDDASGIPDGLNACNCIRIREGKLSGFNTDHLGFEKSLFPLIQDHHNKALILGNGGATSAARYSLGKKGITCKVVSRQLHDDSDLLYEEIDRDIIEGHKLIINTTPLGMYPNTDTCPDIPYHYLGEKHLLFDMIYNPGQTLFLKKGAGQGAQTKNGMEMLNIQAEENWKIWNR